MPVPRAADGSVATRRRPVAVLSGLLLGVVLLAGCGSGMGTPGPVTEQGSDVRTIWRVFLVGAVLVALLVWGLVLWSVLRYRRRGDGDEPPVQRQYHFGLEVLYTVVPVVIVIGLFTMTMVVTNRLTDTSAEPGVTVEVHGFQWQWRFVYPDDGVTLNGTADGRPTLVLPVGETVELHLVADDVIHSFWVPEFLEKRDLIPGQDNVIQIEITEPGEWVGRCAEFCGLDHWTMTFDVQALPRDEFEAWVSDAAAQPQPILAEPAP
jgi:cytochrome c oxidase subunit 2